RTRIFAAHDVRLNRNVIVKKIDSSLARDPEHQALLRREAELFAGFNSGHLVKVLDYDAAAGIIVLEAMAGDLSALAEPAGIEPRAACDLLEQALRGLAALHSQNIAHGQRDESHLLLDDCNQIKLAVTPGHSAITPALSPNRTTKHVAPEMLNPSVFGTQTLAADIYALGFVILELIVG